MKTHASPDWQAPAAKPRFTVPGLVPSAFGRRAVLLAAAIHAMTAMGADTVPSRAELQSPQDAGPKFIPGVEEIVGTTTTLAMNNNEPTIAIDPHNPQRIAVATYLGIRVSTDGGTSFQPRVNVTAPVGYSTGSGGDSSLAYDSQGRLFWTFLLRETSTGGFDVFIAQCNPTTGAILAGYPYNLSSLAGVPNDGGTTHSHDKEWLAADATTTSPFRDSLYVSWTDFQPSGTVIYTTTSTDQGVTWSAAVTLSGAGEGFVWPCENTVAPNGDVYVAYHSQPTFSTGNPDGTTGKIFVLRSTNGGSTFPQKNLAFAAGLADLTYNRQSGTRLIAGTQFWLQGSVQPRILADPKTPGRMYCIVNDQPNGSDFADVFIATSTNNGGSWGAPVKINGGALGTIQVMPSAAIDPVTGVIVVTYYDNRNLQTNAGGKYLLDVYSTRSVDGGVTWSPEIQVNTALFDPDLNAPCRYGPSGCGSPDSVNTLRIGEYNGIAIGGGVAATVWTGNNASNFQDTFFTQFLAPAGPSAVASSLGSAVTGEFAPNAAGANDGTKFDVLKRGGSLAENGTLVFPGHLLVGTGGVTLSPNNYMGLWKQAGTSLSRLARSGDNAPETGATAAKFDVLPQVPAINDSGEVTFLASLAGSGASTPATTVDNDTGLWSELGGTGIGILMREGDTIPSASPLQIGAFASGAYATAHTGASTGEAAFAVTMKNGSTDTAILRASIAGANVTTVGVVARQNTAMPGVAGEQFGNLAGNYTDSIRMDATGNLCFVALSVSGRESIWYQPVAGGSPVKAFIAGTAATGDTAPGTGGATFKNIKSPSIGSAGTISFRGFLNNNGDNSGGLKGDGVWRGTTGGGFTCILRAGDDNTNRAGLGLSVGAKVGNVWHGWLTNANHIALRAWVDLNGNGTSSTADGDVNGIFTDLSGTMSLMTRVGNAAPGIAGATFASVDLPVVGGVEQCAFLGTVTGGGTTAANNKGVWRSAANGGAPTLVLRTGDTMTTSQGTKTISNVDLPGSNTTDRRWEQPVMDSTGRLLVYVTFVGGATTEVLIP
ncbi:MAG: glycoside hydrolase [Verrucomicrobiaceae bacterium]|nr:glycoside hydrolase [Verrucomicrobiaceae bacterium]